MANFTAIFKEVSDVVMANSEWFEEKQPVQFCSLFTSPHQQAADMLGELLEALHDQEKYPTLLSVFSSLSASVGGVWGYTYTGVYGELVFVCM